MFAMIILVVYTAATQSESQDEGTDDHMR